ncbi:Glutathione S-transferase U8 [Abeliophyllum distichum]|uniref:glutathione transferase n=1 Tax=Abeliophyllum distichum TaxID=126358 RepID=A0ABD1VR41_9LAMI
MAEVAVYGAWASPLSKRVEIALKLKGVKFDVIEEDMSNPSRWLQNYNPILKNVPVLIHEGDPVVDPNVIFEYIDETWKVNPIFPQNPKDRAKARFWIKFIDEKCVPAVMAACWGRQMVQQMATQDAFNCLKALDDELSGKKFFGGNNVGAVDIAAIFIALWLGVIEEINGVKLLKPEKFPLLARWVNDILSCSIIQESLPPRDQLISYHRTHNPNSFPPGPGNAPMMNAPFPFPPR